MLIHGNITKLVGRRNGSTSVRTMVIWEWLPGIVLELTWL